MPHRLIQLEHDVSKGLLPIPRSGARGRGGAARAAALGIGNDARRGGRLLYRLAFAKDVEPPVIAVKNVLDVFHMAATPWTLGFTYNWGFAPKLPHFEKSVGAATGTVQLTGPSASDSIRWIAATLNPSSFVDLGRFSFSDASLTLGTIYSSRASLSLDDFKSWTTFMYVVTDNPMDGQPGRAVVAFIRDPAESLFEAVSAAIRTSFEAGVQALLDTAVAATVLTHKDVGLPPASILEGRLNPF